MEGRQDAFGPSDDAWLKAALAIHTAATSDEDKCHKYLSMAVDAAIQAVGGARIDAYVEREWLGARMYVEAVAVLADLAHEAGALNLAAVMMDDLLTAASDLSPLQRGRVLALRARVDRKLGRFEEATERYLYVAGLGREHGSTELEARSEIGFSAIAHVRGNLPEVQLHSQRAADLARANGLRTLERIASLGLTMAAAKTHRHEEALVAGWRTVELSDGDPILEAEGLQNIGQSMLEAGRLDAARASFAAVMTRPVPAATLLNALGGLALVSAQLGNETTVEWCIGEVWRARQMSVPAYELASALLESAIALRQLRRDDEAEPYRMASLELAYHEGFHELTYRAEHLTPPAPLAAEPRPLREEGAAVERDLMSFEPKQLPRQLEFQAAPA